MNKTEDHHDSAAGLLERLSSSVEEAKDYFRRKQYEEASGYLDDAMAALRKADALINEMWE